MIISHIDPALLTLAEGRPNNPEDSGGGIIPIRARAEEGSWDVGAHSVDATNARLLKALVNICERRYCLLLSRSDTTITSGHVCACAAERACT